MAALHRYVVALGSNVPHPRHGRPEAVLAAALAELDRPPCRLLRASATLRSAPVGPSQRTYANAAAVVESLLAPPALLDHLHAVEDRFGRRRRGRPWRARVLDLDIVLWSGGAWADAQLTVPHSAFRARDFVLAPAASIAGDWRDPLTGLSLRHLRARLTRKSRAPNWTPVVGALSSVGRATDF